MKRKYRSLLSIIFISVFLFGNLMALNNRVLNNKDEINTTNIQKEKDQKDLKLENSPNMASTSVLLENLEMAEKTARYIINNRHTSHGGPGFAWNNENGNLPLTYGEGAAGIGDFFLDLYEKTINETYLLWAKNVGKWLNYQNRTYNTDSNLAKWEMIDNKPLSNNYTGLMRGAAGVGKFLTRLYSHTKNNTYKDLSEQTANYIRSLTVPTVNGTGKKVALREFDSQLWDNIQPNSTDNKIQWTKIYGEYESGQEDPANTKDFTNYLQINPNSTTNISIINGLNNNNASYHLGNFDYPVTDTESIVQSFTIEHYPLYINPDEGIKVFINSTGTSPVNNVNLTIHERLEGGEPGTQIGAKSNPWLISQLNDTNAKWVSFNWTGNSENTPIINGSSEYGYCFKLTFSERSPAASEYFEIFATDGNQYQGGNLRIQKEPPPADSYSSQIGKDLIFNITALPTSKPIELQQTLNGAEGFGLSSNDKISNITIQSHLKLNDTLGQNDIFAFQVFNYFDNRWENIEYFSTDSLTINKTFLIPDVESYITSSTPFTIKTRITGGSKENDIAIQIYQYNISLAVIYDTYPYSWSEGVAGIGDFFLDCYDQFNDLTYLEDASAFGNYLLEEAYIYKTGGNILARWEYQNQINLGLEEGMAGIGKYLLRLSEYNSSNIEVWSTEGKINVTYRNMAIYGARQIIELGSLESPIYDKNGDIINLGYLQWSIEESGWMKGYAGIGSFLLDVLDYTAQDNIVEYPMVRRVANILIAKTVGTAGIDQTNGTIIDNKDSIDFHTLITDGVNSSMKLYDGTPGVLVFLSQIQQKGYFTEYAEAISLAIQHLKKSYSVDGEGIYWDINIQNNQYSKYGYLHGLTGVGKSLLKIGIRDKRSLNYADQFFSQTNPNLNQIGTFYGLKNGLAGISYSFVKQYQETKNTSYIDMAEYYASHMLSPENWTLQSGPSTMTYTGLDQGYAGIGLNFLELYKVTLNETYLEKSMQIAHVLLENQTSSASPVPNSWGYSSSEPNKYYTSLKEGNAGIIYFLLKLYKNTRNVSYIESAERALMTLENQQNAQGNWEKLYASSESFNGYYSGTAGIADTLLYAYEITGNNSYYINASNAINFLCEDYQTQNGFYEKPNSETNDIEHIGLDKGYAGYWKVLGHIINLNNSDGYYIKNLTSSIEHFFIFKSNLFQVSEGDSKAWVDSYNHDSNSQSSITLDYYSGMVGFMDCLNDICTYYISEQGFLSRADILRSLNDGKSYIIEKGEENLPTSFGYFGGYNGLAVVMSSLIDNDIPSEVPGSLQPNTNLNIEYDEKLSISISAIEEGSDIKNIQLRLSVNGSDFKKYIFSRNGDDFSFKSNTFPYGTDLTYYIVIKDISEMTKIILNPTTDTYFNIFIDDETEPQQTGLEIGALNNGQQVEGSSNQINYGKQGGGYFKIYALEPENSSGVDHVSLLYKPSSKSSFETKEFSLQVVELGFDFWYLEIDNYQGGYFNGSESLNYKIEIYDNAGNVNDDLSDTLIISDYTPPRLISYLERNTLDTQKSGDEIDIKVNVTDYEYEGGSGVENVTIFYSPNRNLPIEEWKNVSCNKISGDLKSSVYTGKIPGQESGQTIYYFIRVSDSFENINSTGGYTLSGQLSSTTNPDEIPEVLFSYYVEQDWTLVIIIVASVVGALVLGYAVYKFRGSYLDRMRRSAADTARIISVQEAALKAYYAVAERLNKIGDRIRLKVKEIKLKQAMGEWMEDKIESPVYRALQAIWSWVSVILKYTFYAGLVILVIVGGVELAEISQKPDIYFQTNIGMIIGAAILAFLFVFPISLRLSLQYREEKASFAETITSTFYILLITTPLVFGSLALFISNIGLGWKIIITTIFVIIIISSMIFIIKTNHSLTTAETVITLIIALTGLSIPLYLTENTLGKLKTKKVLLIAVIGLVLVVSTVVKYFDAAYYPIRAIFFIDFGFILFIGSFVAIIVHLAYNLVAK